MQGISISWKSIRNSDLLKWLQQHFLCNPLAYNHGFVLQGDISKPSPALEINYICPLLMPCFSEVTPVVETDHAGSWEAHGFQSPPRSKEYRTYKTIRLFLFWTKENRWNNRSPVIQRNGLSLLSSSALSGQRGERGNANNSMFSSIQRESTAT